MVVGENERSPLLHEAHLVWGESLASVPLVIQVLIRRVFVHDRVDEEFVGFDDHLMIGPPAALLNGDS